MRWLLVAALLLAAPAASAQPCDPLPNGIGIYFDAVGCEPCAAPPLYTMVSAYVLATNVVPSTSGLWDYEFKLLVDPPPAAIQEYFNGLVLVYMFPWYAFRSWPADDPATVRLLEVRFLWTGTPIRLGLGPYVPSSGDGTSPMIRPEEPLGAWVPLRPSVQTFPWPGEPYGYAVAWVGSCPVVAADDESWGAVKTLYR